MRNLSAVLTFALLSAAGFAFADDEHCSVETLDGTYEVVVQGTAAAGPQLPYVVGESIPLRALNITTFDGEGHLETLVNTDVVGGLVEQGALTSGTYSVDPDCTGSITLLACHLPEFGGPHVHEIDIVVRPNGRSFRIIFTDIGATGGGRGVRIYSDNDLVNDGEPFCELPAGH